MMALPEPDDDPVIDLTQAEYSDAAAGPAPASLAAG